MYSSTFSICGIFLRKSIILSEIGEFENENIRKDQKKQSKKIVIIISSALMIAGLLLTRFGIFGKGIAAYLSRFDAFSLTDADIGKNVGGEVR